ncbi:hypothetical protein Tco_1024803 [Tanacetum coccineum]
MVSLPPYDNVLAFQDVRHVRNLLIMVFQLQDLFILGSMGRLSTLGFILWRLIRIALSQKSRIHVMVASGVGLGKSEVEYVSLIKPSMKKKKSLFRRFNGLQVSEYALVLVLVLGSVLIFAPGWIVIGIGVEWFWLPGHVGYICIRLVSSGFASFCIGYCLAGLSA